MSDQGGSGSGGGVGSDGGMHDAGPTLHMWGAPSGVANVNSTSDERAPAISANGLELYFWIANSNPPYGDIWVATRSTTAQQFSAPTNVTAVNGSDSNENAVLPAHNGLELFISRASTLMISTRATQAAAWGTPTSTGLIGTMYSLSNDDLSLYLVKRCDAAHHAGSGNCLYRLDRTAIGQTFSAPSFIEWPGGGSNQWNTGHVSGDGLRILLSDPYSGSAVRATQAQRPDTNSAFGAPQVIDALSLESTNGEMSWNAAEDEVYLTAKPVSPVVGGYDIYVSVPQ
ncbi:MAG: hypothetical protein ABJE66_30445 [Deltaproteobacteria bacterium]